jgi:hypothetical protein
VIDQEGNVTWIFGAIDNTVEVMFFKNLNFFMFLDYFDMLMLMKKKLF